MGLGGLKIKPNSSPRSAESLLVTRKNLLSPDPAPFMGLTKDRPLLEERGNGKAASTVSPPSLRDKISPKRKGVPKQVIPLVCATLVCVEEIDLECLSAS